MTIPIVQPDVHFINPLNESGNVVCRTLPSKIAATTDNIQLVTCWFCMRDLGKAALQTLHEAHQHIRHAEAKLLEASLIIQIYKDRK